MKWLKRFNEAESWAGSLWANKNPLVTTYFNQIEVQPKKTYPYKCGNCDVEFFSFSSQENKCEYCHSEDIYSISDSNS